MLLLSFDRSAAPQQQRPKESHRKNRAVYTETDKLLETFGNFKRARFYDYREMPANAILALRPVTEPESVQKWHLSGVGLEHRVPFLHPVRSFPAEKSVG
jgi:hypothetical protein